MTLTFRDRGLFYAKLLKRLLTNIRITKDRMKNWWSFIFHSNKCVLSVRSTHNVLRELDRRCFRSTPLKCCLDPFIPQFPCVFRGTNFKTIRQIALQKCQDLETYLMKCIERNETCVKKYGNAYKYAQFFVNLLMFKNKFSADFFLFCLRRD